MSSDHRLYLLEFLINRIEIDTDLVDPPKLEDILIHFRCPDFLFLDVTAEEFPAEPLDPEYVAKDGIYKFNFGKTYLFTYTSQSLINTLTSTPLEIDFRICRKTIGSANFTWKKDFTEMIDIFESIGVVKSVEYSNIFDFMSLENKNVGDIDLSIKMSCLGTHLETYFSLLEKGGIFMGAKSDVQYKCERYNFHDDIASAVASIYNPLVNNGMSLQKLSWTELFGSRMAEAKQSIAPMVIEFDEGVCRAPLPPFAFPATDGSQLDIVSMVFRPPENKFFDFLNMMKAEVCGTEEETVVTVSIDKFKKTGTASSEDVKVQEPAPVAEPEPQTFPLTAEKINNQLCKHKDCPAAKKFKEYGIGPLATGSGLGTLYDIVEAPVTYGLSNTYGRFEHYGPYGAFRRPKNPNEPYYPPANKFKIENESKTSVRSCSCQKTKTPANGDRPRTCKHNYPFPETDQTRTLRLRGGGMPTIDNNHSILIKTNDNIIKESSDLLNTMRNSKLRTGDALSQEQIRSRCITPKSAITECKPIMDQFDQVVNAYKKALGPCGEATCPYATNIMEDHCKDFCKKPQQSMALENQKSCESIPCNRDFCPYIEQKYTSGCQSSNCAYAKYKSALRDEDAALELLLLPPAFGATCGHPKCDYPEDCLPPIHWDCPDPLPTDNCKNPNCPLQPPALKKLKCPEPRGPCGSISCPYALPKPCENPNCPFKERPCPYLKEKQEPTDWHCSDPQPDSRSDNCKNPNCPSQAPDKIQCPPPKPEPRGPCGSISCPYALSKPCDNPNCPFNEIPCPYLQEEQTDGVCKNPNCPSQPPKKIKCPPPKPEPRGPCGSISCPYALPKPCDNPNCPFNEIPCPYLQEEQTDGVCKNPSCPSKQKGKSKKDGICDNPSCPFVLNITEKNSICDNPNCPFARTEESSICDNPLCPFKGPISKNNICDNPECPFALKLSANNSICDNPLCPFNGQISQNTICDNPECPSKRVTEKNNVCDNPDCPNAKKKEKEYTCENPRCPFTIQMSKKKNVCDNPECPSVLKGMQKESICENPECPAAKKECSICQTSICPFAEEESLQKNKCNNPECPSLLKKKEKQSTCNNYAKNEHVCTNPRCNFTKQVSNNNSVCDNPLCPFSDESERDSVRDISNCLYNKKKSIASICSNISCRANKTVADNNNICENPECPFAEQEIGGGDNVCKNPNCPYAKNRSTVYCKDPLCPKEDIRCKKPDPSKAANEKTKKLSDQPGQETDKKMKTDNKKKAKKRGKFVYSVGDKYPGVHIGHKECVVPRRNVPTYMGWLWNKYTPILQLKPRRGWRPGAVAKTIAKRIEAHRIAKGLGRLHVPKFPGRGPGRHFGGDSDSSLHVKPRPTLKILKKDGVYNIIMNPLKDPKNLVENEDPYMDCTPMQFKITKAKDEDSKLCYCNGVPESSSDSELDIEFTPPAGIIHPERFKKKRNKVNCEAQYDPKDFATKSKKKDKKGKGKKGKGKGKKGKGKGKGKKGKGKKKK